MESLTCDLWNLESVRLLLSRNQRGNYLGDAASLAAQGVSCTGQRRLFFWLEVRSQPVGVHVSSEGFLSKGLLGKTKRPC